MTWQDVAKEFGWSEINDYRRDQAAFQNMADEITRLRGVYKSASEQRIRMVEKFSISEFKREQLRAILELVAMPKRSDGTYNRSREACEELAKSALAADTQEEKLE